MVYFALQNKIMVALRRTYSCEALPQFNYERA